MFVYRFSNIFSHLNFTRMLRNSVLIRIEGTWSTASMSIERIDSTALRVDSEGRNKKIDGCKTRKCYLAELSGLGREFEMGIFIIQGKKLSSDYIGKGSKINTGIPIGNW